MRRALFKVVPLSSLRGPTVPNTPASDSYQRVDDRARASSADDLKLPAHVLFRKDLSLILWKPRGVLDQSTVNEIVAFIEAVEIRCARRAYCLRVASSSYNASTGALRHGNAMPSEADCLRKLELHFGARGNLQFSSCNSMPRLARRPRPASWLRAIRLYRDIASVHRDRR